MLAGHKLALTLERRAPGALLDLPEVRWHIPAWKGGQTQKVPEEHGSGFKAALIKARRRSRHVVDGNRARVIDY